jgi:hypothetical protein
MNLSKLTVISTTHVVNENGEIPNLPIEYHGKTQTMKLNASGLLHLNFTQLSHGAKRLNSLSVGDKTVEIQGTPFLANGEMITADRECNNDTIYIICPWW